MTKLSNINTRIQWNGDSALTLFFDKEADEDLTRHILSLAEVCNSIFSKKLIEAIPAYQSLTLCFDLQSIETDAIEESIKAVIDNGITEIATMPSRVIKIPVCYQGAYAPDLEYLAEYCKLSCDEVIQQHTQTIYLVNMLGFLPGFLYLSGLADQLHCPRKEIPSLHVPAGAVGIGGNQTGVYPVESPGGWHIIGQTPISIFSPNAKQPFIAQPLYKIHFVEITVEQFEQLKQEQA
jgi:KipI family sensor histidine kinase inhibitor